MLLSGDQRSLPIGCRFAGRLSLISGLSAARFGLESAARPLRAHAETFLWSLPGALCVTTVTTGSQPEPSVLVVHSSPDLVVASACQSCSGASTMVESERWLKVKLVSISTTIPYQQRLSTHGPLSKLAVCRGSGAELNNENN